MGVEGHDVAVDLPANEREGRGIGRDHERPGQGDAGEVVARVRPLFDDGATLQISASRKEVSRSLDFTIRSNQSNRRRLSASAAC